MRSLFIAKCLFWTICRQANGHRKKDGQFKIITRTEPNWAHTLLKWANISEQNPTFGITIKIILHERFGTMTIPINKTVTPISMFNGWKRAILHIVTVYIGRSASLESYNAIGYLISLCSVPIGTLRINRSAQCLDWMPNQILWSSRNKRFYLCNLLLFVSTIWSEIVVKLSNWNKILIERIKTLAKVFVFELNCWQLKINGLLYIIFFLLVLKIPSSRRKFEKWQSF